MNYEIAIEGQKIKVGEEIGTSDERVKDMLKPFFPDVVNGMITRTTKDDMTTVNVVKRAGTKGLFPGPLEFLTMMPESENPAIVKAREFKGLVVDGMTIAERLQAGGEAQEAIREGELQGEMMRNARERMVEARSSHVGSIPVGF